MTLIALAVIACAIHRRVQPIDYQPVGRLGLNGEGIKRFAQKFAVWSSVRGFANPSRIEQDAVPISYGPSQR
jgi:hypothetical protein